MALAPYYDKASIAASQVVAGFDHTAFERKLSGTVVGLSFTSSDITNPQGAAAVDLALRLLARLYPTLAIVGDDACGEEVDALKALATRINPRIEFADQAPLGIAVGAGITWESTVYVGSSAWTGTVSMDEAQALGTEDVPFGAGIASCLAVATVFRILFLPDPFAGTSSLTAFERGTEPDLAGAPFRLEGRTALVGAGAIGHAVLWTLARSPLLGEIHCVDGEAFDLSNLQRYVLATMCEVDKPKATFAAGFLNSVTAANRPSGAAIDSPWPDAVTAHGAAWHQVMTAVDSVAARREVQSTLPQWIANGWTQTGDLGVSEHNFLAGACLACLYLPNAASANEDEIVAAALGVPERTTQIRDLLYRGVPAPADLLLLIAERLGVASDIAETFENRPIRELYVDGICGGALIPAGTGSAQIHVPLAHQSALAGVLLAARLTRRAAGYQASTTHVTRIDVRRGTPDHPHQRAGKDARGICICQDNDYVTAYRSLWE